MKTYSFEAPSTQLGRQATRGIFYTGLSQILRLGLQIASVVSLSRLLVPNEFGVLAMATPIVGFAALFQDLGLSQAIVQRPLLSQAEVSKLFYINAMVGAVIALLLALASPLAGRFFHHPEVATLVAALSVNIAIGSVGSIHYALLTRGMRFNTLAVVEVGAAAAALAVAVGAAALLRTYWALYLGILTNSVFTTVALWIATGWRPNLSRVKASVGDALHFGANVTGFNVTNFFARNFDNILIGRWWGEGPLGLYDRAYKLLLFPLQQIAWPVSRVMLPVLSQTAQDPDRYRRTFLRVLSQVLLLSLPGIAFMIVTADRLVPLLLGREWIGAASIFSALGLAGLVQVLNNPTGWLFLSQSRTKEYMWWGLFGSATSVLTFVLGLPYGPYGVAVAYAIGEYVRTPILWTLATRSGPVHWQDVAGAAIPQYLGVAVTAAALLALKRLNLPLGPYLISSLFLAYAAAGVTLLFFRSGRAALGETFSLARSVVRRT